MRTTSTKGATKRTRRNELKTILESHRRELATEVQERMRDVRSEGPAERDVLDPAESSEINVQDEIGFALMSMKAEMLNQITAALRRIEEGNYGDCFECGEEIAEARLRALPFAVRCRDCEQSHEATEQRERSMAQHRGSPALLLDLRS
jgi:DnaK suppressor protein